MKFTLLILILQIFNYCCCQAEPKIVGGDEAVLENSKYVVSLRLKSVDKITFGLGHICGGTLISPNLVVTAAHCFLNYLTKPEQIRDENEFQVVMGTLNRLVKTKDTLVFDVRKIIHKNFLVQDFSNDIGLLILKGTVPENHPNIKPIDFVSTIPKPNTKCQILGWGVIASGNQEGSHILLTANITLFSQDECLKIHNEKLKPGMICAGVLEGHIDSCQGDSGGPLVCNDELVGIVSWGEKCAIAGWPGVYTNIAYYKTWLESSIIQYGERLNNIENSSFVASIRRKYLESKKFGLGHYCSGTFIIPTNKTSSNLVLTSAYCIKLLKNITPDDLVVVFNAPNRYDHTSKTRSYNVKSIIVHEKFNVSSIDLYNIAILKLSAHLTSNDINGPELSNEIISGGESCHTYAWNTKLTPFQEGDEILQTGNATAYNLKDCNRIFNNDLNEGMFCAGNLFGLQDEIQADIGGALICNNNLQGIMLERFDIAFTGYPSVYTDIGYFKNWIEKSKGVYLSSVLYLYIITFYYILSYVR